MFDPLFFTRRHGCVLPSLRILPVGSSFCNMRSRGIISLLLAAGTATAQFSCTFQTKTMGHTETIYLPGDANTPGSIYVECFKGKASCYYVDAIPDKKSRETLSCTEAVEIVKTEEHQRKLQVMSSKTWPNSTICYHPFDDLYTTDQKNEILHGMSVLEAETNLHFLKLNDCSGDVCGGCQHGIKIYHGAGCTR